MKLKVTTHTRCVDKTNPQLVAKGWMNTWLTPAELADHVRKGYGWCATHFADGRRRQANSRGSNCIVFDFDGDCSLDDFWTTQVAQDWCVMTYTSASHTPELHRFRAVFPLDGLPLSSLWEHKCVYQWIELQLCKQLGISEFEDDCGQKPERLWYGSRNAEIHMNEGACLGSDVVESIEIPDEPVMSFGGDDGTTDLDIKRCQWLLRHFILPSEDGEYNTSYLPVTAACAAMGEAMADAWIDWVSRGHHGDKPSNLDVRLKWAGLGQKSGPSSLYAIAKRQDPNWSQRLPQELSFNPGNEGSIDLDAFLAGTIKCVPKQLLKTA